MKTQKRSRRYFDYLVAWGIGLFAIMSVTISVMVGVLTCTGFDTSMPGAFLGQAFTAMIAGGFGALPVGAMEGFVVVSVTHVLTKNFFPDSSRERQGFIAAAAGTLVTGLVVATIFQLVSLPPRVQPLLYVIGALNIFAGAGCGFATVRLGVPFALGHAPSIEHEQRRPKVGRRWLPEEFSHFVGWVAGLQVMQGIVFGAWVQVTRLFGEPGVREQHFVVESIVRAIIGAGLAGLIGALMGLVISGLSGPLVARIHTKAGRVGSTIFTAGVGLAITTFVTDHFLNQVYINPTYLWKLQFVGLVNSLAGGGLCLWAAWQGTKFIELEEDEKKITLEEVWEKVTDQQGVAEPVPVGAAFTPAPERRFVRPVPLFDQMDSRPVVPRPPAKKRVMRERPLEAPVHRRHPS